MNQQQDSLSYEHTEESQGQVWGHNELYANSQIQTPTDGQTWMQQQMDMQKWQQSQHENSQEALAPVQDIEHWIEENQDNDDETVNNEDVMLEVEVESQGSQCSGPLDLSSTEVTIVTMDKNIPVRLAAVVQDDDRSDC